MSGRVYCPECGASQADPFEVLDVAQCGALISGDTWCKGRLTPGGSPHNPAGTEYLMIEACRKGENPPLHFKPGVR